MEIPIQWRNDRETTFQMLVVPRLSWPILFGENHLHSTQALVDHGDPSILFRHPSMSCMPASLTVQSEVAYTKGTTPMLE